MFWIKRHAFCSMLALLVVVGCDQTNPTAGTGADGGIGSADAAPRNLIPGKWVATYKDMTKKSSGSRLAATDDEEDEEDEDREIAASVTFEQDGSDSESGKFHIVLPSIDEYVKGTYDVYEDEITLSITESTSRIGLPGVQRTMDLERRGGKRLVLSHSRFELTLTKRDDGSGGSSGGSGSGNGGGSENGSSATGSRDDLRATWSCSDGQQRTWRLRIANSSTFSIDVTQHGARDLLLDGELVVKQKVDGQPDAKLKVTQATPDKSYVGLKLEVFVNDEETLTMNRLSPLGDESTPRVAEQMFCNKQR